MLRMGVVIAYAVIRNHLVKKIDICTEFTGGEGMDHISGGRVFQNGGKASAEALRWGCTWQGGVAARRPMRLKQSEQVRRQRR